MNSKVIANSILIVEDNVDLAKGFEDILSSLGYTVIIAMDFAEADHVLTNYCVSVVLLDFDLQDYRGNGLSLLLKHKGSARMFFANSGCFQSNAQMVMNGAHVETGKDIYKILKELEVSL